MISIVIASTMSYLAAGTLLAFALGRFMHHTGEREEEALRSKWIRSDALAQRRTA